ncbi:MAG: MFS transporter [Proteobacteria bacterium]|nr:AmpG family muropeptide MFS transporter [Desulfocapsa sp.]MBU3946159.1 MFS transporter [Pseudomonadota bacterium]MBU4027782.1 MFS transporter [Pseudomonadota bacterium]MBU4043677.1 MFS transporter [Pseudomonadota bacterium]MBU4085395.1 MFS transporter [Pseudomonadota bacterium]
MSKKNEFTPATYSPVAHPPSAKSTSGGASTSPATPGGGCPAVRDRILKAWLHPKVLAMFFLGFSAGIPILLIFSTLSVWLREAGIDREAVTFFSWAALGYSFKFVWAPLVDKMPLPLLTSILGRRRGWLLMAQLSVMTAIAWMACINPVLGEWSMIAMAFAAVLLGFSSATQDIVIDAYRIECIDVSMQALLASSYVAGYRVGMLVAGAGSLYLATLFGTTRELYRFEAWQATYLIMAGIMSVGVMTTLCITEPEINDGDNRHHYSLRHYLRFLILFLLVAASFGGSFFASDSLFSSIKEAFIQGDEGHVQLVEFVVESCHLLLALGFMVLVARVAVLLGIVDQEVVRETYVAPLRDFFVRYGAKAAILLLILVGFYRVSDIVLGVVSNVFYLDMGFSKNVIATVTKTFGLGMTLLGGFMGGVLTVRFGVYAILLSGALLAAGTNLLFMLLAQSGADLTMLTVVIGADSFCAGLASTAFIAFLSSLTNISFTAVQYALFSSLMTLFPKLIGGYSGTVVASWGYESFFFMTALMGLPVLLLVWLARGVIQLKGDDVA